MIILEGKTGIHLTLYKLFVLRIVNSIYSFFYKELILVT